MTAESIARFKVIRELGHGGMADVFEASDLLLNRHVAIKILPMDHLNEPTYRTLFEWEARTMASLEHQAIVPVYEIGETEGRPYSVMRLMTGGSLAERIKDGPILLSETIRILIRIAGALEEAHSRRVIHGDLKPSNILFDQHNEPYLSDFAGIKPDEVSVESTEPLVIGTPAYMSPEQGRSESDIDARSDIYSLGVLMFVMLTGRLPYESDTIMGLIQKHMKDAIPNVLELMPELPPDCQNIIDQAMAKQKTLRYPTVGEFVKSLGNLMDAKSGPSSRQVLPEGSDTVDQLERLTVEVNQPKQNLNVYENQYRNQIVDFQKRINEVFESIGLGDSSSDSTRAKKISINDQVIAITQQSAKLRNSVDFRHAPLETIDGMKTLENALTMVSEVLIPFENRFSYLQILAEMGGLINSTLEVDAVLEMVMDTIVRLMRAERGFLMLRDESGNMVSRIARNWEQESLNRNEYAISRTIVERVIRIGDAVITTNAREDPRFGGQESIIAFNLRSILCVPLLVKNELIGVIYTDNRIRSGIFSESDRDVLQAFADQAAIALENARLFETLKRANQELKELDVIKTTFLSTISHELRTPLTPVQSCIQNLLAGEYGPLNDKQRSRLEIALRSTREEARLINNLLDLARIEEGREQLKFETGNLAKIIKDVVTIFEYDAENKQIELINRVTSLDNREITMDVAKIKQVITNLISNAIKFTPPNGKITVSDRVYQDKVEILVKDTGMGIPVEEQIKIFERFYQVDTTLTRKIGGTGIGLNIVKTYVELHKGAIWVESTLGSGSTFHFTLPN
jgi:signal transduction histidine kinase/serine/threonine protein kinase